MKEESPRRLVNSKSTHLLDSSSHSEPPINTTTILESLFSKEFLGNLKNELSSKQKFLKAKTLTKKEPPSPHTLCDVTIMIFRNK